MPAKKPVSSLEEIETHLADIQTQIDDAKKKGEAVPPGLLREKRLGLLGKARLKGDLARLNERAILKSAAWRRVEKAFLDALAPFPDALGAVTAALRKLEALPDV